MPAKIPVADLVPRSATILVDQDTKQNLGVLLTPQELVQFAENIAEFIETGELPHDVQDLRMEVVQRKN